MKKGLRPSLIVSLVIMTAYFFYRCDGATEKYADFFCLVQIDL